jgi:peroxiredoxin Q/BCP
MGVKVIGCSLDDVVAQAKFAEDEQLGFELLSDPDGSAAKKYDVLSGRFAKRVTFVIDEAGVVRHIEKKVLAVSHGTDVVEIVKSLRE